MVSQEQALLRLPVSCSRPLLQGVWAGTGKVALRFDFHHELILMRNVENILSMVPSAQKKSPTFVLCPP